MNYRIISRKNPSSLTDPEKYYGLIVRPENVSIKKLAKRIAEISPVNELDTESVLNAFVRVLPEYFVEGATIELGELGRLQVNISTSGADTPEDFNSDLIKGVNVRYQAGTSIKKTLKQVEFKKVD